MTIKINLIDLKLRKGRQMQERMYIPYNFIFIGSSKQQNQSIRRVSVGGQSGENVDFKSPIPRFSLISLLSP